MSISVTLGVVNFLVVIGNLVVFYVLLTTKSLQTSTNKLVLSLTISDLLLGILILPFAIIQEHYTEWLFGWIGCHAWLSLDVFLSTASIYNLLAISFDRYMAVRQPIKYAIVSSQKIVRLMTFLVWSCSLLLAGILFIILDILHIGEFKTKTCQPTDLPSEYIIFSSMASFIIPAFIMVILNIRIFQTVSKTTLRQAVKMKDGSLRVHRMPKESMCRMNNDHADVEINAKAITPTAPENTAIRTLFSQTVVFGVIEARKTNIISHITQKKLQKSSIRTELRVARTTGIVVAAFVVCWIPFTTIYVLQAYSLCTLTSNCIPNWLFTVAFWLGYSNSAVNPILYAAFSRDFRHAVKRVLFKRRK